MTTERVNFRLFQTPCCGHLLCWVNSRLPGYCPECGKFILPKLKTEPQHTLQHDEHAELKIGVSHADHHRGD